MDNKVEHLVELIKENPELPIVPMASTKSVQSNEFEYKMIDEIVGMGAEDEKLNPYGEL